MNNYLINNSYSFFGKWWLSSDKSRKFYGKLLYNPKDDEISLELLGKKELQDIDFYNDTILGLTVNNIKITLIYCIKKNTEGTIPCTSFKETISVSIILIGRHFTEYNKIRFKTIFISYSDQIYFIQTSNYSITRNKNNYNLNYKLQKNLNIGKTKEFKIDINFAFNYSGVSSITKQPNTEQKEYFVFKFTKYIHFDEFREHIYKLRNFITFLINKPVEPIEIFFLNYNKKPTFLLSRFLSIKKGIKNNNYHFSNDVYYSVNSLLEKKFNYSQWIELYNRNYSSLNKYFSVLFWDTNFLNEEFLILARALEDYHRNTNSFTQTLDPVDIHNQRIEEIINTIPEKYKLWLKKKLEFSNEISLRKRIKEIFAKFQSIILYIYPSIKIRNKKIAKICDARNYLVHGLKRNPIKDFTEYFELNEFLKSIFSMLILNDLNINIKEINNVIYNNPFFRNLLRRKKTTPKT